LGIVLDFCRNHGVWFDHGELRKVLLQEKNKEEEKKESSIVGWIFSALDSD
jgi:Zn-finger nucleic acid-binding protein